VIRREGESLILEGPVTLDTVPGLASSAREHLHQGVRAIDFRGVTDVDSAAVALALDWVRYAAGNNASLHLQNLPQAMRNLAQLYGVSELLQAAV